MVTEQQIFDHLSDILVRSFEIDPAKITREAKLYDDLDIDSIDAVDLIVQLTPFLGDKQLSPAQFKQVVTIGDVVKIIDQLQHQP